MSGAAIFSLTRNGVPQVSLTLGTDSVTGEPKPAAPVNELQQCGFQVDGREPDTEYCLHIGDRSPDGAARADRGLGAARGTAVYWNDATYFDGARGRVWVNLDSKPAGATERWSERGRLPVYVVTSKLSDARYAVMVEQLRGLAAGLIFDLVSKSLRSLGLGAGQGGVSARSGQVELRLLEHLWTVLAPALQEIAVDPVRHITVVRQPQEAWGGERLAARSLALLATAGLDPRRRDAPRPFRVVNERFAESADTVEHRAILGMLRFLEQRVSGCARNVRQHVKGIETDRRLREQSGARGPSLYEAEDVPRLQGLRTALARAKRLGERIRLAEQLEPFRGLTPLLRFPQTPVFQHVRPYHRIRHELHRYLHSSLVVLDDGLQERLKSTSRMYEQWVFFQLAAALRQAGLRRVSREGVFDRARRFRYTLDVDRGARLTFLAGDGRAVSLRYEPWVLPLAAARERGESVYRGTRGEAAWSPDVLLEVLAGTAEGAAVEHGVVIDAKYTARIQDHHWDATLKYMEIRAVGTHKQVVRQVWLAYPDERANIRLVDSALTWTALGPDCPTDERVQGEVGLAPPERMPAGAADEEGWITASVPTAQAFVAGLLAYFGLPPYTPLPESVVPPHLPQAND